MSRLTFRGENNRVVWPRGVGQTEDLRKAFGCFLKMYRKSSRNSPLNRQAHSLNVRMSNVSRKIFSNHSLECLFCLLLEVRIRTRLARSKSEVKAAERLERLGNAIAVCQRLESLDSVEIIDQNGYGGGSIPV